MARTVRNRSEPARSAGNVPLRACRTIRRVLRAWAIHLVERMESTGIRGIAYPGQGSNRRRSLACGVLVLVAAAHAATPSSAQTTTSEEARIVLSRAALTIDEGGSAAYTVALGTRPTGKVRITVWRSSYAVVFRRYPGPLVFTPDNWNVPRRVTLRAVHDDDTRDGDVVLTHGASGGGYGGVPPVKLRVKVADDDEARIVLSRAALTIDEGGSAAYTVALGTRPTGKVRITVWRSSYAVVFRRYPGTLVFTPDNWNVPRTVTLRAVHDDDARDGDVVLTHGASGGGYGGVPPVKLRVKVADDEEARIVLSKAALTIDEGGSAAYTVALGARPTGKVRITLWRSSYAVVFRRYPGTLVFTPDNWNVPRTVTLRAVHDDDARDGDVVLTHGASGGGYGDVPAVRLRVRITDDADDDDAGPSDLPLEGIALDEAAVSLSLHPPSGPTPESARRMRFTLRLSEAIDRNVIVCWRTVEATAPAPTDDCPWGPTSASPGPRRRASITIRSAGSSKWDRDKRATSSASASSMTVSTMTAKP